MSKQQELDLAKVIREKIELTGNNNAKKLSGTEWAYYCKGIRDACLAVDEVTTGLNEKHPCEECQEWECDGCPYSDK